MPADSAVLGQITAGPDQIIRQADQAYAGLIGRRIGDLVGTHVLSFTYGDDVPRNERLLGTLLDTSAAFSITKRYLRGDGSLIWVENHVAIITDARGAWHVHATCRLIGPPRRVDRMAMNHAAAVSLCAASVAAKRLLGSDLLNTPAAELLIWLYRAEIEGEASNADLLADRTGLSVRLVRRWLDVLRERGFADVEESRSTGPVTAMRISQRAEIAIEEFLAGYGSTHGRPS